MSRKPAKRPRAPETEAVRYFIDAIRGVLRLEPLYARDDPRTEMQRFYRVHDE